ncbi:NAD-dependent epimerase/dehydratase family protein [Roseibium aggregatum]|uniref:NAD(P)-dependent oxidoreductase n=1 Tax=Roseibium aggregatum TaxID=187304 RepID=A0A926NXW0_9HYPH|nr:NAD(P)-dependent oxidoreductase [Roseibium aggregatum]MBD1549402.1 NAD(P)-dependent oxidoreductase [Roseibium aggregatum]
MNRVLVTGGTGFLGAWITRELAAVGAQIRLFDLKPNTGNLDFVETGLSGAAEVIEGDIRDADAVGNAVRGCDAVIHLAGLMTVDCSLKPVLATQINLIGSQNVFAAAVGERVETVVYTSTAGVYGPDDPGHPKPMTLYGTLKLAVEGVARTAWIDDGIRSTGFRPYIVYGPGESAGIAAGPSIALRAASQGEKAHIRFSGRVGFVHVRDVARAMVSALTQEAEGAHVYDLGGDYATVSDFADELKRQRPSSKTEISGPPLRLPEFLGGGETSDWFAAQPVTRISDGIAATLAHWDEARDGISFTRAANRVEAR